MAKRVAPFLIIALVAVAALLVGRMLVRANSRALAASVAHPEEAAGDAPPGHARGPENAPIKLEEFGDFQCPACAEVSAMIRSLEEIYAGRMRFVFWEFPLAMHAHAREAAIAAEAASAQGRFWEMHDLLYRNQTSWAASSDVAADFEKFALALHLNVALFQRDLRNPATAARVAAQRDYGVSRGVKNTPTLFLNGKELPPTFSPQLLRDEIDAELAARKKSHG